MSFLPNIRTGWQQSGALPLVAPDQLASGADGSTSTTVVTSSVSPTANGLVIVHVSARGDHEADVTVASLTPGFSISGSWTIWQIAQFNASTSRWTGTITAMARAAGSPGSGTVTVTFSSSAWNKCYSVEEITAGAAADIASYPSGENSGTGTTLSLTLSPTPASDSYLVGASGHEGGNAGAWTFPTSWTTRTVITQSANLSLKVGYKAPIVAAANDLSGLDNNEATGWVVTEVEQAA